MAVAEMIRAVNWPGQSFDHQDGQTEPWIAEILTSLLKALGGTPTVLELGGFQGTTSAWLALALEQMGGGSLTVSEPDEERARTIEKRLSELDLSIEHNVSRIPSPRIIETFSNKSIDFCWVDDDHSKLHVEQEIIALWKKMKKGGIICLHDVWGVCQLWTVVKKYGGISLNLPRLGPAGGLGIIQVPDEEMLEMR